MKLTTGQHIYLKAWKDEDDDNAQELPRQRAVVCGKEGETFNMTTVTADGEVDENAEAADSCVTVCIEEEDRLPDDDDGLCDVGFEQIEPDTTW